MKNRVLRLLRRQRDQPHFIRLLDLVSVQPCLMRNILLTGIYDLLKWIVVVDQHFSRPHRAATSMSNCELRFARSLGNALAFLVGEAPALLGNPSLVAQHVHRLLVADPKDKLSRLIVGGRYVRIAGERLSLQIQPTSKRRRQTSISPVVIIVCFLITCKR